MKDWLNRPLDFEFHRHGPANSVNVVLQNLALANFRPGNRRGAGAFAEGINSRLGRGMKARASWKGQLVLEGAEIGLSLHAAASTSDRIMFHMLNRRTGHRLSREFVDSGTGKPVDDADEAKGFEIADDEYVLLDPDEVAHAAPENDHRLELNAVIDAADFDRLYLDRPYFLLPTSEEATADYIALRDALKLAGQCLLATGVLFRRIRHLVIRPEGSGLVAATLHFTRDIRSSEEAFEAIPEIDVSEEMLDLASHIIHSRTGDFDPEEFDDRYEEALAEVVKAKLAGRKIRKPPEPERGKVVNLLEALREGAKLGDKPKQKRARKKPAAPHKRKAG